MESFTRSEGSKAEAYEHLLAQVKSVIRHESNLIANMANICAMIKAQFDWLWTGFYLVDEANNNLVLGPFQGPLACTRIGPGKGVCGKAWERKEVIVVPDVNAFPGHIACSSSSRSEIVLPCLDRTGMVKAVLDIDSSELNTFDDTDAHYLQQLVALLSY